MLKIGEFAHLCQVSVKTLRYYDEIDLFKPERVDRFTGHRHYTLKQLPVIHRILALKDLGLSLDQIRLMLNDELVAQDVRGMLKLKEAEVRQQLADAQQRLERVRFHLKMIEMENTMSDLNVVVKPLEQKHILTLKWHPNLTDELKREISAAVKAGKIEHTGIFMQLFEGDLPEEDWSNALYVLEVASTQADQDVTLPTMGTFKRRTLAPVAHAATMMLDRDHGDHPREKIAALNRWAVEHGYSLSGDSRVIYHRGPMHTGDRDDWIIELQTIVEPPH